MIDINELRRLAQAATPGPWWVNQDSLNHGFECGVLEINANDWHALAGAWGVTGAKPSEEGAANAAFIAAANPAAINELLDRLEAAEKERDELRAKVEQMERQEPVAVVDYKLGNCFRWAEYLGWQKIKDGARLYTLSGAQPAPSIPEVDALAQFIREIDGAHRLGAGVLAERIVAWLAAAPEAKP